MCRQNLTELLHNLWRAPRRSQCDHHWFASHVGDVGKAELGRVQRHHIVLHLHLALDLDNGVGGQHGGHHLVGPWEEQDLYRRLKIFDSDHCPDVPAAGGFTGDVGDHARDGHHALPGTVIGHQLADADVAFCGKNVLQALQWMITDIEAEHLALEGQLGSLVPVRQVRNTSRQHWIGLGQLAEKIILAVRLVALKVKHPVDCRLIDRHQSAAGMPHRLEGPRLDQRLDHSLVADDQRHLVQEAVEVHSLAVGLPSGHDSIDHVVPDIAYRSQAKTDIGTDRGEIGCGFVDVRWQHLDSHAAALIEVHSHLVFVVGH